jgi:hypothetical protein
MGYGLELIKGWTYLMGEKTAAIPARVTINHFVPREKDEYGFPVEVIVLNAGGNLSPSSPNPCSFG